MFYAQEYTHCVPEADNPSLKHVISGMISKQKGLVFGVNCQGSFLEEISLYTDLNEEKGGLCQVVGQHVTDALEWG